MMLAVAFAGWLLIVAGALRPGKASSNWLFLTGGLVQLAAATLP